MVRVSFDVPHVTTKFQPPLFSLKSIPAIKGGKIGAWMDDTIEERKKCKLLCIIIYEVGTSRFGIYAYKNTSSVS
jgi:hypothetical protein